ncbi:exosortase-associated protein EpsI, B-type [Chitinibacter sp. ZOR0017]|uniref:exosortase-associated protein EpsI, B-type n=1 Tax=Chitinibacter sp. ZOR0017 TaxID=1339254 RepID=UPI0006454A4F|nr:exosortase-associated protein EpsI, B-type [Chitinibacter sp. ZOR0017]
MPNKKMTQLLVAVMMFTAGIAAHTLVPTESIAVKRNLKLANALPEQFGDWKIDPNQPVIEVPAEMQATINKIYSDTISRTYINQAGQRVMIVIAYGKDQGDQNAVHRPEVCYPAQGFTVGQSRREQVRVGEKSLNVVKLLAKQDQRHEPITYWITVGEYQVASGQQAKIAQLKYGLSGKVADGLLFRVSSLGADEMAEYKLQERFITELYAVLQEPVKSWLYGVASPQ